MSWERGTTRLTKPMSKARWALMVSRDDHTLRLWSVASGQTVQTFRGHTRQVKAFAVSPDGKRLVWVSDRNAKEPGEFNVFLADWVP